MTPGMWTPPERSPRIPEHTLAHYPNSVRSTRRHTAPELSRMVEMLKQAGADYITIGHGRHPASVSAARALHAAWTTAGGSALDRVDWPGTAASWLRPARRLTAGDPDAWVLADSIAGCAQVLRRLAQQANWTPARAVGFAGLASDDLVALAAPISLAGMTGPTATGGTWRIGDDHVILTDEPHRLR
jgi:Periplasmic binding protein